MTMMKIIRDKDGKCINIGDWNYYHDENGAAKNLLPDGAYEDQAEVVSGYDGGLYLIDDPKRLGN